MSAKLPRHASVPVQYPLLGTGEISNHGKGLNPPATEESSLASYASMQSVIPCVFCNAPSPILREKGRRINQESKKSACGFAVVPLSRHIPGDLLWHVVFLWPRTWNIWGCDFISLSQVVAKPSRGTELALSLEEFMGQILLIVGSFYPFCYLVLMTGCRECFWFLTYSLI